VKDDFNFFKMSAVLMDIAFLLGERDLLLRIYEEGRRRVLKGILPTELAPYAFRALMNVAILLEDRDKILEICEMCEGKYGEPVLKEFLRAFKAAPKEKLSRIPGIEIIFRELAKEYMRIFLKNLMEKYGEMEPSTLTFFSLLEGENWEVVDMISTYGKLGMVDEAVELIEARFHGMFKSFLLATISVWITETPRWEVSHAGFKFKEEEELIYEAYRVKKVTTRMPKAEEALMPRVELATRELVAEVPEPVRVACRGEWKGDVYIFKVGIDNLQDYVISDVNVLITSYPRECLELISSERRYIPKIEPLGSSG
jgi:hypothetical protein